MALSSNSLWPFSLILLLLLTHFNGGTADSYPIKSKATNANLTGETAWYKQDFRKYLGANVTQVSDRIYRGGLACGSCLQVKCVNQTHCTNNSVNLVVVGSGYGGDNDFLINWDAYKQFFPKNSSFQLPGSIDIVYQRVPCYYPHENITIWVEKSSPSFLQLVPWYVGGSRDIVGVQLREEEELNWKDLKQRNGSPVWWINFWEAYGRSLNNNFTVRFNMSDGSNYGLTNASTIIPVSDAYAQTISHAYAWIVGVKYNSGFQLA